MIVFELSAMVKVLPTFVYRQSHKLVDGTDTIKLAPDDGGPTIDLRVDAPSISYASRGGNPSLHYHTRESEI
jgi:hypothetical protein